jgi:transcriptional regulator with XRE-family HTH domain
MSTDAKRKGKWHSPWAVYFSSLLSERKLNDYDFAKLTDDAQPTIWQYINGDIRPPLKKLELFAHKLRLDPAEKAKFIRMGRLAHALPEVQAELARLQRERDDAVAELAALRKILLDNGLELPGFKGN